MGVISLEQHYPFVLNKLEYDYSDLEPYIDTETMIIHHNKHLKTYIDNLNKSLSNYKKFHDFNLINIIKMAKYLPFEVQTKVLNNAGGVYNHLLYFDILKKSKITDIKPPLKHALIRDFNSIDNFIQKFKTQALDVFGSGYTFLVSDRFGKLKLINMKNQDTPFSVGLYPILLIDVWEHAYYLKHKNLRKDYIEDFMNVIDWEKVNKIYKDYINIC